MKPPKRGRPRGSSTTGSSTWKKVTVSLPPEAMETLIKDASLFKLSVTGLAQHILLNYVEHSRGKL